MTGTLLCMSFSFAGSNHYALSRGSQAASKNTLESREGETPAPKLRAAASVPALAVWETTQACDLKCAHCRVNARPHPRTRLRVARARRPHPSYETQAAFLPS